MDPSSMANSIFSLQHQFRYTQPLKKTYMKHVHRFASTNKISTQ